MKSSENNYKQATKEKRIQTWILSFLEIKRSFITRPNFIYISQIIHIPRVPFYEF